MKTLSRSLRVTHRALSCAGVLSSASEAFEGSWLPSTAAGFQSRPLLIPETWGGPPRGPIACSACLMVLKPDSISWMPCRIVFSRMSDPSVGGPSCASGRGGSKLGVGLLWGASRGLLTWSAGCCGRSLPFCRSGGGSCNSSCRASSRTGALDGESHRSASALAKALSNFWDEQQAQELKEKTLPDEGLWRG